MINKLIIALILLCASVSLAQTTQVTGTITDSAGSSYANGTYNIFLTDNAGNYLSSGVVWIGNSTPVAPLQFTGALDSTGTFSVPLAQNSLIQAPSPATGTLWQFNICSAKPPSAGTSTYSSILIGTQQCLKYSTTVSGSTLNLSTPLSALAPPLYFFNALNGTCEIATGLCGASGGQVVPVAIDMTKPPCNVPSDHTTDITSAFNACLNLYTNSGAGAATYAFFLPRTNTAISSRGSCDYVASGTLIVPKPLFEPTIYGQTQGVDIGSRICTTTTNTPGMLVNTEGATLRNLTFYGFDQWTSNSIGTFVLSGTADGVKVCGPSTTLDQVASLYYSRHGINLDSGSCSGGSTDFASADDSKVISPYTKFNRGNGINIAGSDGNLITVIGGNSDSNQLFGFQDRSLYPATVINLETTQNHYDQNAFTTGNSLTSCSTTGGTLTCTCPSACGIQTLDEVTISGTSTSAYNQRYIYTLAHSSGTSATSFYLLTGDVGPNDGTSATGGTVSYGPGARIWGTAAYLGGCCYGSISGRSTWINMYAENELGPMVNANVGMISGQGAAGNQIFFYNGSGSGITNADSLYFSALGVQILGSSSTAVQNYYAVRNLNPNTNRAMGTIFRPAAGIMGSGGVDAGWSAQAGAASGLTSPQEILEVIRSNTGVSTDGYWAYSLADNVPTNAADTWMRLYDSAATTQPPGTVEFPNTNPVLFDTAPEVNGINVTAALTGTTGSIGSSPLTAGTCATGTATVTGATSSMSIIATPSNSAGPGAQFFVQAYLSAANTVTVAVCTDLAGGGTPTATTYNVRAIP